MVLNQLIFIIPLGALSLIYVFTDPFLNLKMIQQSLPGIPKKLICEDTPWDRLMSKIGTKNQLYSYFVTLLFIAVCDIGLAVWNCLFGKDPTDDVYIIIDVSSTSLFLPLHLSLTFKLLDLFLVLYYFLQLIRKSDKKSKKAKPGKMFVSNQDVVPNCSIGSFPIPLS